MDVPKLSTKDLKSISICERDNPICKYLRNKENIKFKIGDILIKLKKNWGDDKFIVQNISDASPVPAKYLYVYESADGVGYIKRIKPDGDGVCDRIICLADCNFDYIKYQVDPDYVEHIILTDDGNKDFIIGDNFKEMRKARNKIHQHNKKLAIRIKTAEAAFELVAKLKVGDPIWFSGTLSRATEYKYEVISAPVKKYNSWGNSKEYMEVGLKYIGTSNTIIYNSDNLVGYVVYLTEPLSYETKI